MANGHRVDVKVLLYLAARTMQLTLSRHHRPLLALASRLITCMMYRSSISWSVGLSTSTHLNVKSSSKQANTLRTSFFVDLYTQSRTTLKPYMISKLCANACAAVYGPCGPRVVHRAPIWLYHAVATCIGRYLKLSDVGNAGALHVDA